MKDLERYLKQASRGLPRLEGQRVREELRSSILERAAEHQVGGLSESEALTLALREFGDPALLGAGMRRIHLWPQVGLFGGLAAITLSLVILNWPHALGQQVQVTTEGLVPRCTPKGPPVGVKTCSVNQRAWVNITSLREQLKKQGVNVEEVNKSNPVPANWNISGNAVQDSYLRANWQEYGRAQHFEFPISDAREQAFHDHMRKQRPAPPAGYEFLLPPPESVFTRAGTHYVDVEMLMGALLDSATMPLSIENPLDGPILHVGRITLALGTAQQGVEIPSQIRNEVTRLLYSQYGSSVYFGQNYLPQRDVTFSQTNGFAQQTKVSGKSGEVYAVLFPVTANKVNGLGFDLTTVDATGKLNFRTAHPTVHFTKDIKALANAGEGKAAVVLLRLGCQINLQRNVPIWHQVEVP